jgi:predicted permease
VSSADFWALLLAALAVSAPTFAWVIAGLGLRRAGLLSEELVARLSLLAFRYGLPVMLFTGAAQVDYSTILQARYLAAGVLATVLSLGLSWLYGRWRGFPLPELGVFMQAAFRSNLAIVGIAMVTTAFGAEGIVLAALPIAVMTVLYNILAVIVLDSTHGGHSSVRSIVLGILKNPLIIGITLGALLSISPLATPHWIVASAEPLAAVFLPVTLICIGASMRFSALDAQQSIAWEASCWRLLLSPAIAVATAMVLGVEGRAIGVLFLLVASPVAASSFVMVVAVRGNGTLAANIIVLTTLLSVLTVTAGLFVLAAMDIVTLQVF